MYVLEFRKMGSRGKIARNNIRSFENFDFLMRTKKELEMSKNICSVYKISNNGKEITRLTDKNEYEIVTDYDKEMRKGFKQYKNICALLLKVGEKNFYVENDILYIKSGKNVIEIEMVRKTPRYEIRFNNKLVADKETSQNDIIDKLFVKDKSRLVSNWNRPLEIYYE